MSDDVERSKERSYEKCFAFCCRVPAGCRRSAHRSRGRDRGLPEPGAGGAAVRQGHRAGGSVRIFCLVTAPVQMGRALCGISIVLPLLRVCSSLNSSPVSDVVLSRSVTSNFVCV